MSEEFADKTTEELHDMVEFFEKHNWSENAEMAVAELMQRDAATAAELQQHGYVTDAELTHTAHV